MKIRIGALLITSLLTACSVGGGSNTEDLPALSDSTIAVSTTSPDETPTTENQTTTVATPSTVVPSEPQPECDLAALAPDEDIMRKMECGNRPMLCMSTVIRRTNPTDNHLKGMF